MAKRLANLWQKLTNRPPLAEIVIRDEGFEATTQDGTTRRFVRWTDIREIRAYKEDEFTLDRIFLAVKVGDDEWVEISERQKGFHELSAAMEARFPQIPPDWLWEVAVPAFDHNETVLHPFDSATYSRQIAERQASLEAPRADSLSIWDMLCVLAAGLGCALLLDTGHRAWAVTAAGLGVLILVLGIGLRRRYAVHEMPASVRDAVLAKAKPERISTVEDLLTKADFNRVVPLSFRLLFALVKTASIANLLGGMLSR